MSIDVLAAAAGVAASWIVADLVLSLVEARRPVATEPRSASKRFMDDERIAGVFHLGMAVYDAMHVTHHTVLAMRGQPVKHFAQLLPSVGRLLYHLAYAYPRHLLAYSSDLPARARAAGL